MNDHRHVALVVRCELSKTMNQRVLLEKPIPIRIVHSHHELKIVDDDVLNVVNGDRIAHRLQQNSALTLHRRARDRRLTLITFSMLSCP
jgi:hypothetical protein